jgi:hypothetical protein
VPEFMHALGDAVAFDQDGGEVALQGHALLPRSRFTTEVTENTEKIWLG